MAEEHSGFEALGDIDLAANSRVILAGSMADGAAPNNSIYYSTTQNKLVYKDSVGAVHDLY